MLAVADGLRGAELFTLAFLAARRRGAHQRHGAARAGSIGQRSLNAQGNATMRGAHS